METLKFVAKVMGKIYGLVQFHLLTFAYSFDKAKLLIVFSVCYVSV